MPNDAVEGICPFCRLPIRVDWDQGVLEHALPMCEQFKKLSADDFVRAVINGEHKN